MLVTDYERYLVQYSELDFGDDKNRYCKLKKLFIRP